MIAAPHSLQNLALLALLESQLAHRMICYTGSNPAGPQESSRPRAVRLANHMTLG
ncbi:MAG: hypothetical protein WAU68_11725 [Vitreimonas sp.]